MSVVITAVEPQSSAGKAGILPYHELVSINGAEILDVLDYRFHMTGRRLELVLLDESGTRYTRLVRKAEYDELGLEFGSYLMDKQQSCRNGCVFCFIDQMPPGLRDTLYFKDDDSRMSFLFGNYITLTNLQERDVRRIMEMHISPVNISVHTTDPALRASMMRNPRAGEVLSYIPRLCKAGIKVNAQLVLCPGINDGAQLERSLSDLCALAPELQSVSVVPVGLTKFRGGLTALRLFTKDEAADVIKAVDRFGGEMEKLHGTRITYPADEFFLLSQTTLPDYGYYGDFLQLENGVGLITLLRHEFAEALAQEEPQALTRRVTIATGRAAYSLMSELADMAMAKLNGLEIYVSAIDNNFFGHSITVAGLICGRDLISQLSGRDIGDELLFPCVMLRHDGDLFLDDISVPDVEKALGCRTKAIPVDGAALLYAIIGR